MIKLEVQHLAKNFTRGGAPTLKDISFTLYQGEILSLIGPSGCGKTTVLRLIAGLEMPDSGRIRIDNRLVCGEGVFIPPEQRGVGMLFQEPALFPHLRVFDNVAFGLRGQERAQRREIVLETLKLVGLEALAQRYPHALSGGERQRVALARVLAPRPRLLLLDEPFSSLDADLRAQMREQVRGILKQLQASAIFVTHDQEEALYMGDRLALIHDGTVTQIGQPEEIYHAAKNRFVAEFMGDSDFLQGRATPEGIQTALGRIEQAVDLPSGSPLEVALRADDVDFFPHATGNGAIAERFFRGGFYLYRLHLDSGETVHARRFPAGRGRADALFPAGSGRPARAGGGQCQPPAGCLH